MHGVNRSALSVSFDWALDVLRLASCKFTGTIFGVNSALDIGAADMSGANNVPPP